MLDVPSYLARIGYSGPIEPNAENLRALHYAHLIAIPFENLDLPRGRTIVLDEVAINNKLLVRGAGVLYDKLNGPFAALLRSRGFNVTLLSARAARADGS